jgi:hypothetical protein
VKIAGLSPFILEREQKQRLDESERERASERDVRSAAMFRGSHIA